MAALGAGVLLPKRRRCQAGSFPAWCRGAAAVLWAQAGRGFQAAKASGSGTKPCQQCSHIGPHNCLLVDYFAGLLAAWLAYLICRSSTCTLLVAHLCQRTSKVLSTHTYARLAAWWWWCCRVHWYTAHSSVQRVKWLTSQLSQAMYLASLVAALCCCLHCRWLSVGLQLLQRPFYSDQVLAALALSAGGGCTARDTLCTVPHMAFKINQDRRLVAAPVRFRALDCENVYMYTHQHTLTRLPQPVHG